MGSRIRDNGTELRQPGEHDLSFTEYRPNGIVSIRFTKDLGFGTDSGEGISSNRPSARETAKMRSWVAVK